MADLGSKTTDGSLSFTKYVTKNPRFKEIEFEIEKGKKAMFFVKKNNKFILSDKEYSSGVKLNILEKDYTELNKIKLATVKIKNTVGLIPINTIRKPTGGNGTQYEDQVVDAFNEYIKNAGGKIDLRFKGDRKTYKNISYAIKVDSVIKRKAGVKGDPKADIILCADKKNPLAEGSIYISHKKEGGPEAFQQYGGLSEQAGDRIYNHEFVQTFLANVAKLIGDKDQLTTPVLGEFNDPELANMSIYGPDYGKEFSIQHTQIIGQGNPVFRQTAKYVEVDFSSHMSLSGDLSHFTGGYLPVFGATFRAGRGFTYKGKRYNGARVAIYPQKLMATRGNLIKINIK